MVITKWLRVQEVLVTTVFPLLHVLADYQAVPRQGNVRSEKPSTSSKKHVSKQEQPIGSQERLTPPKDTPHILHNFASNCAIMLALCSIP